MPSQKQGSITVKVPGSSANLGPGFDVLSMAITSYVWASDAVDGMNIFCDQNHIALKAFRAAGGSGDLWFRHQLPSGRGVGFSAAARTAGAMVAYLQQGMSIDLAKEKSFRLVRRLEGHGDNAAASVYGKIMIVSGQTHHQVKKSNLFDQVTIWIPENKSATTKSRAALVSHPPLQDAVANIGSVAILMAALYENNTQLLGKAMDDRLHQQQRLASLPASLKAYDQAQELGATAVWLSGSGPSIAYVRDEKTKNKIDDALQRTGRLLQVEIDTVGACIV